MSGLKRAFSFKFGKKIDDRVVEFANVQDNLTDTIVYLIEKEIAENGIRNLQEYIPSVRNILDNTTNVLKKISTSENNIQIQLPKEEIQVDDCFSDD